MGWSCGASASKVERAWSEGCRVQTGSSNVFIGTGDMRHFYELSRTEHRDGAITGTIWRYLPCGEMVRKAGSFRINGDGTIARAPKSLKKFSETLTDEFEKAKRGQRVGHGGLVTKVAY